MSAIINLLLCNFCYSVNERSTEFLKIINSLFLIVFRFSCPDEIMVYYKSFRKWLLATGIEANPGPSRKRKRNVSFASFLSIVLKVLMN